MQKGRLGDNLHTVPVVAAGNDGGLLDSKLVVGSFSKKSEIGVKIAANSGLGIAKSGA